MVNDWGRLAPQDANAVEGGTACPVPVPWWPAPWPDLYAPSR
jgi:hypothetical protein